MTRSAYVDLEFRSKLIGFDEVESRINKLVSKLDNLSKVSGEIKVAAKEVDRATTKSKTRAKKKEPTVKDDIPSIKKEISTAIVESFSGVIVDFSKSFQNSVETALQLWIPTTQSFDWFDAFTNKGGDLIPTSQTVDWFESFLNKINEFSNKSDKEDTRPNYIDVDWSEVEDILSLPMPSVSEDFGKLISHIPFFQSSDWVDFTPDDLFQSINPETWGETYSNITGTPNEFQKLLTGDIDKGYTDAEFEVHPLEVDYDKAYKKDSIFSIAGFDKAIKAFGKMAIGFIGSISAIKVFKDLIKTIVEQSQVFQAIVQLVFHPFVMMVNFMLLPVLKWLIPNVAEWLRWTVDNKDTLTTFGDILVAIAEAITVIVDSMSGFSEFVNSFTNFNKALNDSDLTPFEKFIGAMTSIEDAVNEAVDNMLFVINPLSALLRDSFMDSIESAFDENLLLNISESIKSFFIDVFDSIPFIGDALKETFGLNDTKADEFVEPVGISKVDYNGPIMGSNTSSSNTDLSVLLLDSQIGNDDMVRLDPTMSSILRGRMGAW